MFQSNVAVKCRCFCSTQIFAITKVIIVNVVQKKLRRPRNIKHLSWRLSIKKEVNFAWAIVCVAFAVF